MRLVATGGIVGIAVILGRAALVLAAALAETVVIRAPRRVRPVAWGHVVFPRDHRRPLRRSPRGPAGGDGDCRSPAAVNDRGRPTRAHDRARRRRSPADRTGGRRAAARARHACRNAGSRPPRAATRPPHLDPTNTPRSRSKGPAAAGPFNHPGEHARSVAGPEHHRRDADSRFPLPPGMQSAPRRRCVRPLGTKRRRQRTLHRPPPRSCIRSKAAATPALSDSMPGSGEVAGGLTRRAAIASALDASVSVAEPETAATRCEHSARPPPDFRSSRTMRKPSSSARACSDLVPKQA
jgi:hypothetical protein